MKTNTDFLNIYKNILFSKEINIYIKDKKVKLIKKNKGRLVLKADHVYLKLFKLKLFQKIFNIDPAKKEFEISLILYKKARSPRPLVYIRKSNISLFAAEEIKGSNIEWMLKANWQKLSPSLKKELFKKFVCLLLDLKTMGILQRDFHLNNILWDENTNDFKLIDLHRASVVGNSLSDIETLEQLRYLVPPFMNYLSMWDLLRFTSILSQKVSKLRKKSCRIFLIELAYKDMRHQFSKKFARRVKKTYFIENKQTFKIYKTQKTLDALINFILKQFFISNYSIIQNSNLKVIKNSRHTFCAKVFFKNNFYFIKAYRASSPIKALGYLFRRPKAIRAWYASLNLIYRGINTPKPLFLIQGKNPWRNFYGIVAYSWMNELEQKNEILRYILLTPQKRTLFLKRLSLFLWDMHHRGVFHGDCKITNFYFDSLGENIGVFDLDAIRFRKTLDIGLIKKDVKRMAKSLDAFLPKQGLGKQFISYYSFLGSYKITRND